MLIQIAVIAGSALTGLVVLVAALLRGWSGWLALRRLEIEQSGTPGMVTAIELADIRERLRKLEAQSVANGRHPSGKT